MKYKMTKCSIAISEVSGTRGRHWGQKQGTEYDPFTQHHKRVGADPSSLPPILPNPGQQKPGKTPLNHYTVKQLQTRPQTSDGHLWQQGPAQLQGQCSGSNIMIAQGFTTLWRGQPKPRNYSPLSIEGWRRTMMFLKVHNSLPPESHELAVKFMVISEILKSKEISDLEG